MLEKLEKDVNTRLFERLLGAYADELSHEEKWALDWELWVSKEFGGTGFKSLGAVCTAVWRRIKYQQPFFWMIPPEITYITPKNGDKKIYTVYLRIVYPKGVTYGKTNKNST